MAKTVEDILRESGLTDEQIKALDAKVVAGVTQVLSTATQAEEAAERAKRIQQDQYDKEISPALADWANRDANLTAERDYYKAIALKAKDGGFVAEAPPFTATTTTPAVTTPPARTPDGKFVAGNNTVPGSPQYMSREDGFAAVSNSTWFITEYMRLHNGAPPPDDFATLASQAGSERMPFKTFVEKKYDFAGKREKIKADAQKAHDDAIRAEATAAVEKKFSEAAASNPNVRRGETSEFSKVNQAVKEGKRPDPLTLTENERVRVTRNAIRQEVAENATVN